MGLGAGRGQEVGVMPIGGRRGGGRKARTWTATHAATFSSSERLGCRIDREVERRVELSTRCKCSKPWIG